MDPLLWQERRVSQNDLSICSSKHSLASIDFLKEFEKSISLRNMAETASMEELSRSFSELCLDEKQEKPQMFLHDRSCNPFIIRLRNRRSKMINSIFPSSWDFSNFKGPLVNTSDNFSLGHDEELFAKYHMLYSKPIFSYPLSNSVTLLVYRAIELESKCVDIIRTENADQYTIFPCSFYHEDNQNNEYCTTFGETFSCVASNAFAAYGPLTYIYRRHSRFGKFLLNLVARAGRLNESASHSSKARIFDYSCQTDSSSKTNVENKLNYFLSPGVKDQRVLKEI